MKKAFAYFAVLLVLSAFALTFFAHAGDLPTVPLTGDTGSELSEVNTDYEVTLPFPSEAETKALTISRTQLQLIYHQKETLTSSLHVTWKSDNESVVKIDATSGKLSADGTGTATVTATADDGRTATCTVTVEYAWWQKLIRIFLFGWLWY